MPVARRFVPLLALLTVLVAAPAARAALTPEIDLASKTVTITGDDNADNLVISDTGTLLTHNISTFQHSTDFDTAEGTQTVDADETWTLVIRPGGGDDTVTIMTNEVVTVDADLGAGDDAFQGSAVAPGTEDTIRGGAGRDRVAGGRDIDDLRGGEGNDTLVWNNGDGSDEMDGESGSDTAEVNGAPAEDDKIHVKVENGMARLDRINLGLFHLLIEPTTERLRVNSFGGHDTVTAGDGLGAIGVALEFNGGHGDDQLTGGDAADTLNGGDDVDTLNGGGGGDRIAGDRGDDTLAGGDGDDTLAWNDGDGSDQADGDAGFDVMEVAGAVAGDALTIAANGPRTKLDRTNLAPFTLDFAAEVLDLDTLGGDDTVTASGAPPVLLDLDGGPGNDALTGGAGHESLRGGTGADTITGGAGSDALDGDEGDDVIAARDDQADLVRCGAGTDRATLDAAGTDAALDCETAERPASPPPPGVPAKAAAVRITTGKVTVRKLRARLRLECPAGATACQGRLTLTTPRAVRVGRVRVIVVLGSASYRIAPGTGANVTVKLSKALRSIARKARSVRVAAVAAGDAGAGATLVTRRTVTLVRKKRW